MLEQGGIHKTHDPEPPLQYFALLHQFAGFKQSGAVGAILERHCLPAIMVQTDGRMASDAH